MKKIHIDCSFTPGFDDSFDIESPIDIPIIDSLKTLWDWMQHWKADGPFAVACFYNVKPDGNVEYKAYQVLSSTYVGYNDEEPVRSFASPRTIKMVNDAITQQRQIGNLGDKVIVIPRSGIYPKSNTLISSERVVYVPFSIVEQKIADIL